MLTPSSHASNTQCFVFIIVSFLVDLPGDGNEQNELESRLSRRGQCQAEKDA